MKRSLILIAALALAACAASPGTADQPPELKAVRAACASDALIRPSVNALLAVPGLAQPADVAVVKAAQLVIDGICANPTADKQLALATATGQVIAAYADLKARRAASAPG